MVPKILVVEDEKAIADILEYNLRNAGYETAAVYDGNEAMANISDFRPDLILLDLMLPGRNGLDICESVRDDSDVPILILTARDSEEDVVRGLDAGADDYVTKPFSPRELLARVRAQLRRGSGSMDRRDEKGIMDYGRLQIDTNLYQAYVDGEDAGLTRREYQLLLYLAEREGRVVTRKQLLQDVWGYSYFGDVRTVDVTVRRLREKIEIDPSDPSLVTTRRGVGYLFTGDAEE
ncbi:MAG: response regulator [Bacillota bacterium]